MRANNIPAGTLTMPEDRVDVWILETEHPNLPLHRLESLLSKEEIDRANRFRFDHLRRKYVLSRGSLRVLCSHYLQVNPASLAIDYGTNGKPNLEPGCKLQFNVSHSGDLIVLAFASDLEIGVDVERIRNLSDIELIVQRFFCPEEATEVLAPPEAERSLRFHRCWTRKEAFIKATGNGLSTALDSFRVNLKNCGPQCMLHVNFDEQEGRRWTMQDLHLSLPYVGALCYRAPARPVNCSFLTEL